MRRLILASLLIGAGASSAQAADEPKFFISPMGEPFQGPDAPGRWFDQADTDHDGALTLAEMTTDAARFFAILDRRHDGEIDPEDLEYYETVLAPEIRVRGSGMEMRPSGDGDSDAPRKTIRVAQGAARFSYFDYPEPVIVADRNFNRGVDATEFRKAAEERFALLDKNGDGKLEKGELPRIDPPSVRRPGGRDHGGRPGGPGGGMRPRGGGAGGDFGSRGSDIGE
jgi:hypothetical protein